MEIIDVRTKFEPLEWHRLHLLLKGQVAYGSLVGDLARQMAEFDAELLARYNAACALRRDQLKLEEQRQALEAERQALEAERQAVEAERAGVEATHRALKLQRTILDEEFTSLTYMRGGIILDDIPEGPYDYIFTRPPLVIDTSGFTQKKHLGENTFTNWCGTEPLESRKEQPVKKASPWPTATPFPQPEPKVTPEEQPTAAPRPYSLGRFTGDIRRRMIEEFGKDVDLSALQSENFWVLFDYSIRMFMHADRI